LASKKAPDTTQTDTKTPSRPFIDAKTALTAYTESKKWLRTYFDPLDEFERLARNRPSTTIPKGLPKVTDGTLAAIVQEQPKRIVQQTPTGLVECKDYPEYAKIADYELQNCLIPMSNRNGDRLQKSWLMLGKAMTYGLATSYSYFTSTNGKQHVDFVIPYVKDVIVEKGKVYAPDSNIGFMRSWYQKRDLQAIINREKALMAKIKDYKSEWDLKALADLMESGPSTKDNDSRTPAEKEKGGDVGGFEVIHAFQNGKNAEFYSFSPSFGDGRLLRTKTNSDPRGVMPLNFLYCNIDLSNPLGRGQVELSGGVQNLIDQQMQMFQFMSTLEMGPPLQVWGSPNKASLKMRPNAIWDMGTNPNNKVEPYTTSNFALVNFPTNYGLLKSQILNLNSAQDHSISSDSGSPAQSKTQAGVQAAESRLGVSDNYLRKQFEAWDEAEKETEINLYFAEMKGSTSIKLKGEELAEMMKTPAQKYIKDDTLTIPYKEISNVSFKFNVDPSSSEVKEDADNVDKLTEVYKILQSDPDPSLNDKKTKLLKVLIDEIGAEGTDELFPELDKNQNPQQQAPEQPQITPQMVQQLVMQTVQQAMDAQKQQPKTIAESLAIKFSDLPEDAKQQVLKQIGINSTMPSPQHIDQSNKVIDSAHNAQHAQDTHDFNVQKAAVDTIQNAGQQEQSHQLAQQQADSAQQASQDPSEPTNEQPADQPLDGSLTPGEQTIVHELLTRGFDENDAEQAITMLRQGVPEGQIIQTLTAKQGAAHV
jgi:hypothetical protein